MNIDARIFVTGHRGMVGSALVRKLRSLGFTNLLTRTRQELDLTDQAAVQRFLMDERPDYVFLAAAKVGGIQANNQYRADFIHQNLAMECNHDPWCTCGRDAEADVSRLELHLPA